MSDKRNLIKTGIRLEYATLLWNMISFIPLLILSNEQHSLSLFGFGVDSMIEILASVIVIWQLKAVEHKKYEPLVVKILGISFIVLSCYLLFQACLNWKNSYAPEPTYFTICWLVITAAIMFLLAAGKAKVGKKLGNVVLVAESKVTVIDGLLAVSVLVGLMCVKIFGWLWMDMVSGMVIAFYGFREAYHAFKQ